VANALLYGSINGIVAVPAMVSFVAIIFQARWQALAFQVPGMPLGYGAVIVTAGCICSGCHALWCIFKPLQTCTV